MGNNGKRLESRLLGLMFFPVRQLSPSNADESHKTFDDGNVDVNVVGGRRRRSRFSFLAASPINRRGSATTTPAAAAAAAVTAAAADAGEMRPPVAS